ncbi:homeobox protein Hox-D3-like [Microplitis mediator]|uniref:homeobox protein Hox-D3-like n=1 Tax=Microplitis mediator TaxID=375433 RepID=UPI00255659A2|nr:homeobox protein Hox-D3-like [Microplitis mediator]
MSSFHLESTWEEFMNTPEILWSAGPGESSSPSSSSDEVQSPDHPLGNISNVDFELTWEDFMNTPEILWSAASGESSSPSSSSDEVQSPDHPLGNISNVDFEFTWEEFMNTPEILWSAASGESRSPSSSSDEVQSPDHPLGNIANVESDKTKTKDQKPKRNRHNYKEDQRLHLEDLYSRNRYISRADRIVVAAIFGLAEKQIKVWFQNRRQAEKKQRQKQLNGSN